MAAGVDAQLAAAYEATRYLERRLKSWHNTGRENVKNILTASALAKLDARSGAPASIGACALDDDADALSCWYVVLGDALARGTRPPPPHVSRCLREAVADGDSRGVRAALCLALAREHLSNLQDLEAELAEAAIKLARQSSGAPTGRS